MSDHKGGNTFSDFYKTNDETGRPVTPKDNYAGVSSIEEIYGLVPKERQAKLSMSRYSELALK